MPEMKKTVVFFEGDDDKAFLESLELPDHWQLARRERNQHPGKDGLIRQLLPVISPVSGIDGRAIVLVDLDDLTPPERAEWFRSELSAALRRDDRYAGAVLTAGPAAGRVQSYRLEFQDRIGRVALVPVGHADDAALNRQYQIDRFAIDDWVLRLALHRKVYENLSDLQGIAYDVAVRKFTEVAALFRQNGLEVRKAKTYVQILRALAAIGPSTATIVGRLVKKGRETLGTDEFAALLQPLLDDLASADALVHQ